MVKVFSAKHNALLNGLIVSSMSIVYKVHQVSLLLVPLISGVGFWVSSCLRRKNATVQKQ